jgi:excisionase family DNA binding protein
MARPGLTPEEEAEHLLTPSQVGQLMGVEGRTVTRWAREGRVAAITTPGGHHRFRRSDVDDLINERNTTHE